MKIKEKVIHKTIKEINKRLVKIGFMLDANPLGEILELRIKGIKIIKETSDNAKLLELLKPLAKKEKELIKLSKKIEKADILKLLNEQDKLQCELGELNGELYFMGLRKNG